MARLLTASPCREQYFELLDSYIQCGKFLLQKCDKLQHISGVQKLRKKGEAELKYLTSLQRRSSSYEESNITSSNLSHFLGVIDAVEKLPEVTQVLQAFWAPRRGDSLHVDVVAGEGQVWAKVVARKAQALHQIWAGQGQYGERDLMLLARDFLDCTAANPVNFVRPTLVLIFYNGVTCPMAAALEEMGVVVVGDKVKVSDDILKCVPEVPDNYKLPQTDWKTDPRDNVPPELLAASGHGAVKGAAPVDICSPGYVEDEVLSGDIKDLSIDSEASFCHRQFEEKTAVILGRADDVRDDSKIGSKITEQSAGEVLETDAGSVDSEILHCRCTGTETSGEREIGTKHQSVASHPVSQGDADACDLMKEGSVSNSVAAFIATRLLTCKPIDFGIVDSIVAEAGQQTIHTIQKVNLDITALITLVSAVTHGRCHFVYKEKILSQQAAEERRDPVLPKLTQFLRGKSLYACQTAVDEFQTILDTLGGQGECARAVKLLRTLTIVPDSPSARTNQLPCTGRIKERSKVIFGTGDSLQAVTVTANSGFVRAAEHQGVSFAVYLHASRALTEEKEKTATPVCSVSPECSSPCSVSASSDSSLVP